MSLFRLITASLRQMILTQARTLDGEMILNSYINYVRHIVITKQLHIGLESAGRNFQIYTRQDGTHV